MAAKRHRRGKDSSSRHAGPTRGRHAALEGTLRVARPGSAEVETAEGTFRIAPRGLREGMDGDLATVTLVKHGPGDPLAQVQSVIHRATERFVGSFEVAGPLGVVVPLDERLRRDFFVLPSDESPARHGVHADDLVVARILTYPSRQEAGVVTVERRLGSDAELDVPIERVIASHGLAVGFSQRSQEQAQGISADVGRALSQEPRRRDLRDLACVTVDPVDARDFDDAVSCERTADGGFELGVHIADVSEYVGWGTPIDLEARERICSAYLADRVLPMLPERLCNDVCSLRPGEDRLAMSVLMRFDDGGALISSRACASAIRSRARLDYDTVDEVLAGRAKPEVLACEPGIDPESVAAMLRDLDALARLRERIRAKRGAIDFEGIEAKVTLDEDGHPTGVRVRRKTPATSLVEEAMLAANEVVAGMLAAHEPSACAFRVHERPAPEHLRATLMPLREFELLGPGDAEGLVAGDPFAIQRVLARAEGTRAEYLANTLLLRAMKRAVYLPENDGHYALGARAYCHFTSPIRRYPDVTAHRALKRLLGVSVPAAEGKMAGREWHEAERLMPQLCRTCSDKEREADAAAHESQKIKMAEFMSDHLGESFSGIVVGCERFGLFVRLDDTCAEGLLPVRSLGDEWFHYDEGSMSLTGEASGMQWHLGKRVAVAVSACDPSRGQITFALAGRAGARKDR